MAGIISPFFSDKITISRYDLFKTGGVLGDASLRGYDEYSVGGFYSKAAEDGIALLTSTLELRYPLLEQQLYLLAFADAGDAWPSIDKIDLGNLKKGAGVGLRINIPMMGMMGFDLGYGFNSPSRTPFGGKPNGWKWHFLMGNMAMQ
jgi:outer membrane protein insertion porin family